MGRSGASHVAHSHLRHHSSALANHIRQLHPPVRAINGRKCRQGRKQSLSQKELCNPLFHWVEVVGPHVFWREQELNQDHFLVMIDQTDPRNSRTNNGREWEIISDGSRLCHDWIHLSNQEADARPLGLTAVLLNR
jgi:hypothetical protein